MRRYYLCSILVVGLFMGGCAAMKDLIVKPEVTFADADFTNISLFEATPVFQFNVSNPNPIGLSIQNITYDLKINRKKFVKGVTEKQVALPAKGNSIVALPFTINYLDLFDSVAGFLKSDHVEYDLSGTLRFGILDVPYRTSGNFRIPELPEISLDRIHVDRIDLSGAKLVVDLGIENKNDFAVNLSSLDYGMKLGNTRFASGTVNRIPAIDKNGAGRLRIPLNISFMELGKSVADLLTKSSSGYELTGDMTFDIPKIGKKAFPFQTSGQVPFVR